MKIGTSRIGIGRIGVVSASYEEPSVLANITILGTESPYVYANMSIVDVYELSVLANMDIDEYNHREVFSNMSILGRIPISISANMSAAERVVKSVSANMSIITTRSLTVLSNMSILGSLTSSILSNMSILDMIPLEASAGISIADLLDLEVLAAMSISGPNDLDILSNITISDLRACVASVGMDIISYDYWAIGFDGALLDITGTVYEAKPAGFGLKINTQRTPASHLVRLQDDGIEGGERSFTVIFSNDTDRQTFQTAINNDAEDIILHCGRSDRYHHVKMISVEPEMDELWRGHASLKITCKLEDPNLYHTLNQGVDLGACILPQDGLSKYNYGSMASPILFTVGGKYNAGQLTLPYAKCMDGATEETSLSLGPGLLSNEEAELTLEGSQRYFLVHTYTDDYSTNNYWPYDTVQSGCALSAGQVSVPSGCWYYYKFQGYPTKDPIRLIATITKTGSPLIQYSTDGVTWATSITASEIESGVTKTYDLTDTEKRGTIYIRFYSPVGSSMTVQDVSFSMERDISSQHDEIPMIPVGETRILRVSGSGSTQARITEVFRSRWHPQ